MKSKVYVLCFSNDKLYVGVSLRPERRLKKHLGGYAPTRLLMNAAMRHGRPSMKVIFSGSRQECMELEQYLVDELGTIAPKGYNLQRGGMGGSTPSRISRERMVKSHLGKKHTEETKARMRVAHVGRPPISEKTRQRLSKSAKVRGMPRHVIEAGVKGQTQARMRRSEVLNRR